MANPVAPQRQTIYVEDVKFSASVSEAVGNKIASGMNFINKKITKQFHFGVGGANYSGLSSYPYTFENNSEISPENYLIQNIFISNKLCGTSGNTAFYLEKRAFGTSTWTSMFSTGGQISSAAGNNLVFTINDSTTPTGVTKPVLATGMENISVGDEIRFVLVSAASGANNLFITLEVSPT